MRYVLLLLPFMVVALIACSSGESAPDTRQEAPRSSFDKANLPSYDGADLSGYATFLAKDDPNNCTASFVSRVQRFASDTFTYQPLVYPEDTNEFVSLLRSACSAAGQPIR